MVKSTSREFLPLLGVIHLANRFFNPYAARPSLHFGWALLVGLIGSPGPPGPIPELFNAAFRAFRMDWSYVLLPVDRGQLREALLGLRALGFVGAEVAGTFQNESPVAALLPPPRSSPPVGAQTLARICADIGFHISFLWPFTALVNENSPAFTCPSNRNQLATLSD